MTQKEMVQIMGVSIATYGRIERCVDSVRLHSGMVKKICDYFEISADVLLGEDIKKIPLREERD